MRNNFCIEKFDFEKTKEKALNLLEYRAHSRKELFDKLRKVSDIDTINDVLDLLEENGLIDDELFAYQFAHDSIELKMFGAIRIRNELYQKGIQKDIGEAAIEKAQNELPDESERIDRLLNTKFRNIIDDKNGIRRTISGLLRMGYDYGIVKEALRNYEYELEDESYD